jgi:DNA-binding transcriptional regulator YiaG
MKTVDLDRLESAVRDVSFRLGRQRATLRSLSTPDLGAVRGFVRELNDCIASLDSAAGIAEDREPLVRTIVVQGAFQTLLLLQDDDTEAASRFLIDEWRRTAEALAGLETLYMLQSDRSSWLEVREPSATRPAWAEHEIEILAIYNTAVFEVLRSTENQLRGRDAVRRLMAQLALSYDQLGRAFGISGETLRRWERGSHEIPADRMASLVEADGALKRLLTIFKPARLAHVLRRKVALFGDESALDWILRGRISEVADRYDVAFVYQG